MPITITEKNPVVIDLELQYGERTYVVPHFTELASRADEHDLADGITLLQEIRHYPNNRVTLIFEGELSDHDESYVEDMIGGIIDLFTVLIDESLSPE